MGIRETLPQTKKEFLKNPHNSQIEKGDIVMKKGGLALVWILFFTLVILLLFGCSGQRASHEPSEYEEHFRFPGEFEKHS